MKQPTVIKVKTNQWLEVRHNGKTYLVNVLTLLKLYDPEG